jgi:5-methylcytosine-specific restriction endonuclease McrA
MFVYQRDAFRCQACGAEERLTLDHIHPILHGGTNSPSNLRVLCVSCNSSKGARV